MKSLRLLGAVAVLCCPVVTGSESAGAQTATLPTSGFPGRPSGVTFITSDLDASIAFYQTYLGYKLRSRRTIDQPAVLGTFSVPSGESIGYANMVPGEYSEETRNFVHLNFAEAKSLQPSPVNQDAARGPIASETVLAFSVTDLERINAEMLAAGVPVILPLARSASGRSIAVTVLDPNGVRVQLYEFLGS